MQVARFVGLSALIIALPFTSASVRAQSPELEELTAKLAHPDFKTRQGAVEQLTEWGLENMEKGIELFYEHYRNSDDPEVRGLSREILRELVIFKQSSEGQGYLGIRMQAEDLLMKTGEVRPVVRITTVMDGTPAATAGLKEDDLIVGIDDVEVGGGDTLTTFGAYVQSRKPRTDVTVHVLRAGEPKDVVVNLMRRPADLDQRAFLWGGAGGYVPPKQEEVEEKEFREWLRDRRAEERQSN